MEDDRLPGSSSDLPETTEERTFYDMCPDYLQRAIGRVPEHMRLMEERELRKLVRPNSAVSALRNSFWLEYNRQQEHGGHFKISNILAGICTIEYFSGVVCKTPGMVAWITRPPISYSRAMEEILSYGLERLREIMEMPFQKTVVDKKGFERITVDTEAAKLVMKAFHLVDQRKHGAYVQKNLHLSGNIGANQVRELAAHDSMEDIDRRIRALKAKEKELEQPGVIEVTSEVEVSSEEGKTSGTD